MKPQKIQDCQSNPEDKNKAGLAALPDFRQHWRTTVIKTGWHWHKTTHTDQQNSIEPRNKPTDLWTIDLQQRRPGYTMERDSPFNKWCWESWLAAWKSMNFAHILTP